MPMRSFGLKDPEAYDIICRRRARADRNLRGAAPVKVMSFESQDGARRLESDVEADAQTAFEEWQWHLGNGRIGDLSE